MALRRFDMEAGGTSFAFKPETERKIAFWRAKYPDDKQRSAVIPMLWLAQKDNNGWLSEPAMREVADRLDMPYMRVYEVATFYTMFRLQPVGKHHIQLCGTTPCQLRGAEDLRGVCESEIGEAMYVTDDGRLSWEEVECLGACVNAPMAQINDDFYEDLTAASFRNIIRRLRNGAEVAPGPQIDRVNSAPEGGTNVLTDPALFDGTRNKVAGLPNLATPAAASAAPAASAPSAKTTLIDSNAKPDAAMVKVSGKTPKGEEILVGEAPMGLARAPSAIDDLLRIKGIGPKNLEKLNAIGIYAFAQIAGWSQANMDWIEAYLGKNDAVEREKWVEQAKLLAAGGETDHSRRVDAEKKG
jgi:NADH-quinone oxidoreductase subunit E